MSCIVTSAGQLAGQYCVFQLFKSVSSLSYLKPRSDLDLAFASNKWLVMLLFHLSAIRFRCSIIAVFSLLNSQKVSINIAHTFF